MFPEDGECREDRRRAFWVVVFDHNPAYNSLTARSNEASLDLRTENLCRVK